MREGDGATGVTATGFAAAVVRCGGTGTGALVLVSLPNPPTNFLMALVRPDSGAADEPSVISSQGGPGRP